jgi:hypothetical protein
VATGSLYFHSPCFDGIVSAVLAYDFLEARWGWSEISLNPVNYDARDRWLSRSLRRPFAIVDFLYHPDAHFWADHHSTAFLTEAAKRDFNDRREAMFFDERAPSCAGLLWRRFKADFGFDNSRYEELVQWADKIDSASYTSVDEAIRSEAPALRVALGLAVRHSSEVSIALVRALRKQSLHEIASLPFVRERHEEARTLIEFGLERFKRGAHLEDDGIVVFDVDSRDVIISRYAPFYFFPGARYSAGVVRWEGGAKITAMRNPWRDFPSVALGALAAELGGGGHQRVGSIALRGAATESAATLLNQFVSTIRHADRSRNSA